jgi:thymidylate kinase
MKTITNEELLRIKKRNEYSNLSKDYPPLLVVIDGVDGVGKTTIVNKLIEQLQEKDKLKCIFNTFKRRRRDNLLFATPTKETEYIFRSEVVSEINRRIITFDDETDIIIIDKSPYSEYYY